MPWYKQLRKPQGKVYDTEHLYEVKIKLDPEWFKNSTDHKDAIDSRIRATLGFRGEILRSVIKDRPRKIQR